MSIYYVYAYVRKSGVPYYIGKGQGRRAYHKTHSVKVPDDLSHVVFVETGLTEVGAYALERRLIEWYGRSDKNPDTGVLLNRTDGGEGVPNWKSVNPKAKRRKIVEPKLNYTEQMKMDARARFTGKRNPMYGKMGSAHPRAGRNRTPEQKLALSQKLKAAWETRRKREL